MIRGFVTGIVWGGVVAGIGLAVVSQVMPRLPDVPVRPDAAQVAAEPVAPKIAADPEVPLVEPRPTAAPLQADTADATQSDASPPSRSESEVPPTALAPPAPEKPAPDMPQPEAVAAQSDDADRPGQPTTETAPVAEPAPPGVDEALLLPGPTATQPLPSSIAPELALDPAAQPAPAGVASVTVAPVADPAPMVPDPAPPAATPVEPGIDPNPPLIDDSATLAPDGGLPAAEGVTIGRLPRIGPAPDQAETAIAVEDSPPWLRYARAFDNPGGKPLFAILLADTGGADVDRAALAQISFPITFVIDPALPDAAAHAKLYRDAGQEVVLLATGIPDGATPADLEQTFQSHAASLPEAVAVIDLDSGGFQNNRPLSAQVVPILLAQGRGLVTFDQGLNAADQEARRAGLPSAMIFRRLDGDGETASVIRRYLDRASFKAAQEGRVLVIGDVRPDTVTALLEWTVEGRAASVALAPLTALLRP